MSAYATPPGADLDLQDPTVVADIFRRAAQANRRHPMLNGSVIDLPKPDTPGEAKFVITGDMHDNSRNFLRVLKLADLAASKQNYLVLHELVHGNALVNGVDMSVIFVARVAALKLAYPDQVLLLQSNHDLAQLRGEGILKAGVPVVEAFDDGLDFVYGDGSNMVREALNDFFRSYALAVRCGNGIFVSHSLPAPRKIDAFDETVLDRVPTEQDLTPPNGAAYLLVWGRNHNDKIADELAEKLDCDQFVVGHQPADMGWRPEGNRILILNSDHQHGVALPVDLAVTYTQEELIDLIKPLNAVTL